MRKITLLCYGILPFLFGPGIDLHPAAQEESTRLRVNVVLVELNMAVTDSKGNYVNGLRPEDFAVAEDKIPEKISSFEESDHNLEANEGTIPPPADLPKSGANISSSRMSGSSVFVLFDTSN
jgi:Ca-activated chloride channel family protein